MKKDAGAGKGSKTKKILIWGLVINLLIGGSVIAMLHYGHLLKALKIGSAQATEPESQPQDNPPQYVSLDPPFVVNLNDDGMLRYLQVSVAVMTRDKELAATVAENMPHIRNNLIFLFGKQKIESLNSPEGKENLRSQALQTIQEIMRKETGKQGVEEVFFTNFVMQ